MDPQTIAQLLNQMGSGGSPPQGAMNYQPPTPFNATAAPTNPPPGQSPPSNSGPGGSPAQGAMNIQSVQPFNATSPQTVQQGMQQSPLSPQMQAQAMNAIFNQAPNQINQAMQMQQQQQPQMPWSQYLPPL